MKRFFTNTITNLSLLLGLVASLVLCVPTHAATVALATSPLATSTTTAVKPNVLFVLDNSGSMSWTFMPDVTFNFSGDYGYRSAQCNGVYYDPTITYSPPVKSDKTSYPNASFTAARDDGYDNTTTARNLNSDFTADLYTPSGGAGSLGPTGAYYYNYNGAVTYKNYNDSSSTFYTQCNTSEGTNTTLFTKRKLASNETTVITVNNSVAPPAPTTTITVTGASSTSVSSITVNGTIITSGSAAGSTNNTTAASNLAAKITASGYSATSSTNVITITGPLGAAGSTPNINKSGSDNYATAAFVINSPPVVSSITVNGVQLMASAAASDISASTTAANIAAKINQNGFTAVASSNNVVVTGPTSAANFMPVITASTGIIFAVDIFPETSPAKLTNFANWYSYYRTRMLMMKTSAGLAFSSLDSGYRVGLMQINNSVSSMEQLGTFETTKRDNWYTALYSAVPNNSTPLREALANAGRYYSGKLSSVTDPTQYSCQQNFTILSTDGYWNGNAGFMVDGSTAVGNQDDTAPRPYYDGAVTTNTWTYTYTRDSYSKVRGSCPKNGGQQLSTQTQEGTCTLTTATGSCTPTSWSSRGSATISGACNNTAAPSPTAAVFESTSENTTGGSTDTLADVAMYYYQTDLRTTALGNCGTPVSPATVGPLCEDNVFKSANDNNTQQHMTTFTLGLGASGKMNYSADYLKVGANPDYSAVRLGSNASSTVCTWQTAGTTCNWPVPGSNLVENIDDLWHAAVNGRGTYFSATNPDTLASGLSSALAGVNARKGAAAAAATSTLNPVSGNNAAYVASYTTIYWSGNLEARSINTDTGVVSEGASWCVESVSAGTCATTPVAQTTGDTTIYNCETPVVGACSGGVIGFSGNLTSGTQYCKTQVATACSGTMPAKVAATSDTRNIKTANAAGTALINFDAAYATANPSNFDAAKLLGLSQWSSLTSDVVGPPAIQGQRTRAVGANLLNYLRGQYGYEDRPTNSGPPDNQLFRFRSAVMGDALESQPAYIGKPVFSYPYPGYDAYKTAQASREGIVYMGANDGMMHAFHSENEVTPTAPATCVVGGGTYCGGEEAWAYVPSMVIPSMWKLADFNYAASHVNLVNGSPITTDVCTANCTDTTTAVWKTILVGGLNGGGRGYYALDITNPSTPVLLWEITTTAGIGKVKDDDIGYSFGQPIVTRKTDGTWVVIVTSGYNNVSPGDGKGYLYVLNAGTGAIISKISTGIGSTTTPSGLAKVAGYNNEPQGNSVGYIYGGDLQGNVWRFNINGTTTANIGTGDALKFATLFSTTAGTAGTEQPITTTPVLGKIAGSRVIFIGTGKYLEIADLSTTQQQTQYAIKDDDSGATFVNPRSQTTLMVQRSMTTNAAAGTRSIATGTLPNFNTGRGWFVDFPVASVGERVNIDSSLVQGVLLVPSIVPSNTACSPGGSGWLNFLDYKTGGAVTSSSVVAVKYDSTIVGVNVFYINGNPKVAVVTDKNPTPSIDDDVLFPANAGSFTGKRSLWRELVQ